MIAHWPPHAFTIDDESEAALSWARAAALFADLPAPDHLVYHSGGVAPLIFVRFPLGGDGRQFAAIALIKSSEPPRDQLIGIATRAAGLLHPEAPDAERLLLFTADVHGAHWLPVDWIADYDPHTLVVREVGARLPADPVLAASLVRIASSRGTA
jgi:hypothetical protein